MADLFCRNGYKILRWQKERVANKISENFHLSKALLFGIGCASLRIDVELLGGPKSVMGRSCFQHKLHNFLDAHCPVSLFVYNYHERKPWLQSRLNRSGGKYFPACRNHLQASREGACEVTALDVVDWWQKAWYSYEEEVFSCFKEQENFFKFNNRNVNRNFKNGSSYGYFPKFTQFPKKKNHTMNRFFGKRFIVRFFIQNK